MKHLNPRIVCCALTGTFSVNQRLVDEIVMVSNDEIRAAMALVFERLKVVIEPSGAVSIAALLSGRLDPVPARVGVVVSSGNIGLKRFHELEIQ